MPRIFALLLGSMLALGPGWAIAWQDWRGKPVAKWTLEDALEIQSRSPWVVAQKKANFDREADRYFARPLDGGYVHYSIRLRSARPMLLAQACQEHFLIGPNVRTALPLDEEEALAFADQMQARNQIVVAVASQPPQFIDQLNRESLESLKPSTRLSLEPEGTIIRLQAFIPPLDSLTREALFIFPRPTRSLEPAATLRFVTEFGLVGGKKVQLDARFKICKLNFEGKPEY